MFVASLVFLLGVSVLIVTTVDVPRVEALSSQDALSPEPTIQFSIFNATLLLLGGLWLVFFAELIFKRKASSDSEVDLSWMDYAVLVCPPLRLALPNRQMNGRIWLPIVGWRIPGKPLLEAIGTLFQYAHVTDRFAHFARAVS